MELYFTEKKSLTTRNLVGFTDEDEVSVSCKKLGIF